ncbi:hypothetical protein C2E23DRAFT_889741 [Lenzites betulinus]|nr:hypothetical protein C2E23DRAFT_890795 [Lenzites betulinus]KAH9847796.1 hypothetical protein C2E23DRAFT_889741 [Lenzites betulinus]
MELGAHIHLRPDTAYVQFDLDDEPMPLSPSSSTAHLCPDYFFPTDDVDSVTQKRGPANN